VPADCTPALEQRPHLDEIEFGAGQASRAGDLVAPEGGIGVPQRGRRRRAPHECGERFDPPSELSNSRHCIEH
jgi:hypothetical protein